MKKADLKKFMIVRNGYGNLFILLSYNNNEWAIGRGLTDEEYESGLYDDCYVPIGYEHYEFNDDLVHVEDPIASITKIYDSIPVKFPFELDVESLYDKYKPKLLWEREPTPVSLDKLNGFQSNKEVLEYIGTIVPPYIIVE